MILVRDKEEKQEQGEKIAEHSEVDVDDVSEDVEEKAETEG
jgi:hypothetical protein